MGLCKKCREGLPMDVPLCEKCRNDMSNPGLDKWLADRVEENKKANQKKLLNAFTFIRRISE